MKKNPDPRLYDVNFFRTYYPKSGPIADEIKVREERAVEFLVPLKGERVLDVGCGDGSLVMRMAERGADCVGIDYSKDAIGLAEERKAKSKQNINARVEFKVMDATRLEFKRNEFDRVVSVDTIEHIYPEPLKQVLGEMDRVCRSPGVIVMRTAPNPFFEVPFQQLGKFILKKKSLETDKYHVNLLNWFSLKVMVDMIRGEKKVLLRNDGRNHFSAKLIGMDNIPKWVYGVARNFDGLLDSKAGLFMAEKTPLGIVLARDLWVQIER